MEEQCLELFQSSGHQEGSRCHPSTAEFKDRKNLSWSVMCHHRAAGLANCGTTQQLNLWLGIT